MSKKPMAPEETLQGANADLAEIAGWPKRDQLSVSGTNRRRKAGKARARAEGEIMVRDTGGAVKRHACPADQKAACVNYQTTALLATCAVCGDVKRERM